jgi:flagellar protein FlbB
MAEKNTKATPKRIMNQKPIPDSVKQTALPKKRGKFLKIIFILVILIILLGLGFAVGIYLKLIDVQKSAEDMNLQDKPFIGKFFQKPKTNFDPVDLNPAQSVTPSPGNSLTTQQGATPGTLQGATPGTVPGQLGAGQQGGVMPDGSVGTTNPTDLAKLAKQKQAQETKKISKLARLYGNMKPAEAVPILTQLDDATVVAVLNKMEEDQAAQILAQFDPAKAAQISQAMLAAAVIQ